MDPEIPETKTQTETTTATLLFVMVDMRKEPTENFSLSTIEILISRPFSGRNLTTNPYLLFNNSLRRLILVQGKAGDDLLEILDDVEKMGAEQITKEDLEKR